MGEDTDRTLGRLEEKIDGMSRTMESQTHHVDEQFKVVHKRIDKISDRNILKNGNLIQLAISIILLGTLLLSFNK